jgi:hypothetical protein
MKKKDDDSERISDRDNYVKNRTNGLIDFAVYLQEAQKDKPSIDGIICGLNFQQFSVAACFRSIREQESYANGMYKGPYIDNKEEKQILKQMIKDAKKVFGKDYQRLYDHYNKGLTDYD